MIAYEFYEKNGILHFGKTLSSIRLLFFPRTKLSAFFEEPEAKYPAVYLLYNQNTKTKSALYIGETEAIGERLKQHDASFGKTFWTDTVVCQTPAFSKAHYKFLEYQMYKRALSADRYFLTNKVSPTESRLPGGGAINGKLFFEEVLELLPLFHLYFFEHPQLGNTSEDESLFYCYHELGTGKLEVLGEGKFLLLKDSVILFPEEDVMKEEKEEMIRNGILLPATDTPACILQKEIPFESENEAACFVMGSVLADWTFWTNRKGENLESFCRKM